MTVHFFPYVIDYWSKNQPAHLTNNQRIFLQRRDTDGHQASSTLHLHYRNSYIYMRVWSFEAVIHHINGEVFVSCFPCQFVCSKYIYHIYFHTSNIDFHPSDQTKIDSHAFLFTSAATGKRNGKKKKTEVHHCLNHNDSQII